MTANFHPVGGVLGLMLVCCIDCVCPPRYQNSSSAFSNKIFNFYLIFTQLVILYRREDAAIRHGPRDKKDSDDEVKFLAVFNWIGTNPV